MYGLDTHYHRAGVFTKGSFTELSQAYSSQSVSSWKSTKQCELDLSVKKTFSAVETSAAEEDLCSRNVQFELFC